MNAIPIASRAAAANRQYPAVIFDCADIDLVIVAFHKGWTLNPQIAQINIDFLALLRPAVTRAAELSVSRTCDEVIIDHPNGLHEGVADR